MLYTPIKKLLPSALDELALDKSLIRLPNEDLINFKKRVHLENLTKNHNTFPVLQKLPSRIVGIPEIAVAKIDFVGDFEYARLVLSTQKIDWYSSEDVEPTETTSIQSREESFFISDVIDFLQAISELDITILNSNLELAEAKYLQTFDNLKVQVETLSKNKVSKLNKKFINNCVFSNTAVFQNSKTVIGDVTASGDYFIDKENGIIHSYDIQSGIIMYEYMDFPIILYYNPVRVFTFNEEDFVASIEDNGIVNVNGASFINDVYNLYPYLWIE